MIENIQFCFVLKDFPSKVLLSRRLIIYHKKFMVAVLRNKETANHADDDSFGQRSQAT